MKTIALIVFVIFWFVALYFGWIQMVAKAMRSNPETDSTTPYQQQKTSKDQSLELQQRQQELLRQRQDRMRDMLKR